ncbi:hypothetical protein [Pseudanabaena sp. PCC 6802]|uniref:hypothetical protein n=1 Tax=Pseudanabaena sp. PCC 6802 TaxID=118173 RepID=UPI00034A0B05|nr:hypothetical protein [Pseudanabaena sp. PCC 6802]
MIGKFWDGKYLPLHSEVGEIKNESGAWQFILSAGMVPMVVSHQTKKVWVLSWETIHQLALDAGIDE